MKSELHVKEKDIVVPGQVLATGMEYLPSTGTYRAEETIRANQIGLVHVDGKVMKIIPLAGRYLPKKGDMVIGRISDVLMSGWRLDMHTMYEAVLPISEASNDYIKRGEDLTRYFAIDDLVVAKIIRVSSQNLVDVSMRGPALRKLEGGRLLTISSNKVPRVIGKRGSMVSMIKRATECDIMVGQNGVIWISGEPAMEVVAVKTIELIDKNSHVSGLTQKIKKFLEDVTGNEAE